MDLNEAIGLCNNPNVAARMQGWADGDTADLEAYIGERETAGDDGGAALAQGWLAALTGKKSKKAKKEAEAAKEGEDSGS